MSAGTHRTALPARAAWSGRLAVPRPAEALLAASAACFLLHLGYVAFGLAGRLPGWIFVDVVHNATYVFAALACTLFALRGRGERAGGAVLGVGMLLWGLANVYWTVVVRPMADPPLISPAEVMWLGFYPVAYIAVLRMIHVHLRPLRTGVIADSLAAGLAVLAVGSALVVVPVVESGNGDPLVTALSLAYPVGDVALLALVAGLLTMAGWTATGAWRRIAAGIVVFAVADVIYALQIANGGYHSGTLLDACWPAGMLLMAYGMAGLRAPGPRSALNGWATFVVPAVASAVATAVLVAGNLAGIGTSTLALALAAQLVVAARIAMTVRELRTLSASEQEARTDSLTGLPNRRAFYEALERSIAREHSEPFGVLLIDLDGFKDINDTLGHLTGDAVLREVGARLASVPGPERILARLGGDEFAVLLPGAPLDEPAACCGWLEEATREAVVVEGVELALRLSAGLALFPRHGLDARTLFSHADVAMYQAKAEHRLWEVYDPRCDPHSRQRLTLVSDLKRAIAHGELTLHYQPQVAARDGGLVGFEALVRWNHPLRGLIAPDDFISVAESTGLIVPLTTWVLGEALDQLVRWREEGLTTRVAVNIDHGSLLGGGFAELVELELARRGLAADMLKLEITETMVLQPHRVQPVLSRLRARGVSVSLDDFGTGHSSLAHLKDLEVDELKVDRSFVRQLEFDAPDQAIVRAMLGLATALGIQVVAEGVESIEALTILRDLGCQTLQGYAIARPAPPEALAAWVECGSGRPCPDALLT